MMVINFVNQTFPGQGFAKAIGVIGVSKPYFEAIALGAIFPIPKDYAQRSLGNTSQSLDLAIDWSKVIRKVRIDKDCTDTELISVQQACFSVGINPVIEGYAFIGNIHKPANCVDKEFERFDIDAMPGSSRITIK